MALPYPDHNPVERVLSAVNLDEVIGTRCRVERVESHARGYIPRHRKASLAARASKKLKNDELLVTGFAATRLRMELDRVPLWRGDHVSIKQIVEDFARYLYLPRVSDPTHGQLPGTPWKSTVITPFPRVSQSST